MNITRTRRGRKVVSLLAIALFTIAFTTVPAGRSASAAEPSEQLILSGEGVTNDGALQIGFWIWCQPEGNGPNYTGACRGSVLVRGQGPADGVAGFVVENPDGTYVARVFATRGKTLVAAAFHNVNPEPTRGPSNLVQFGILTNDNINRVGVAPAAVVNVTGPGD
jgi:hypothetical protein